MQTQNTPSSGQQRRQVLYAEPLAKHSPTFRTDSAAWSGTGSNGRGVRNSTLSGCTIAIYQKSPSRSIGTQVGCTLKSMSDRIRDRQLNTGAGWKVYLMQLPRLSISPPIEFITNGRASVLSCG